MFSTEIFIDNLSPNITSLREYVPAWPGTETGAIHFESLGSGPLNGGSGGPLPQTMTLDASRSNILYSSSTVKPESNYVLMIIKE